MLASRVDERNPPQQHTNCNLTPRLRRRSITQEQTTYPFMEGGKISGFLALQPKFNDANGTDGLEMVSLSKAGFSAPVGRLKVERQFQARVVFGFGRYAARNRNR